MNDMCEFPRKGTYVCTSKNRNKGLDKETYRGIKRIIKVDRNMEICGKGKPGLTVLYAKYEF